MKLEAVWILTNLFYGDHEAVDTILGRRTFAEGINDGFEVGKHQILKLLNTLLYNEITYLVNEDLRLDMRMLS